MSLLQLVMEDVVIMRTASKSASLHAASVAVGNGKCSDYEDAVLTSDTWNDRVAVGNGRCSDYEDCRS